MGKIATLEIDTSQEVYIYLYAVQRSEREPVPCFGIELDWSNCGLLDELTVPALSAARNPKIVPPDVYGGGDSFEQNGKQSLDNRWLLGGLRVDVLSPQGDTVGKS